MRSGVIRRSTTIGAALLLFRPRLHQAQRPVLELVTILPRERACRPGINGLAENIVLNVAPEAVAQPGTSREEQREEEAGVRGVGSCAA